MDNYYLTPEAQDDLIGIWEYSRETWDIDQADLYYDHLVACLEKVGAGHVPEKRFRDLPVGVEIMRCQQHYIFFMPDDRPIIFAILHGSMDMLLHLKNRL